MPWLADFPLTPFFAGVAAAVTAADIAGAFGKNDYDLCVHSEDVLVSAIMDALVAAIVENTPLGQVLELLGPSVTNKIKQMASDMATDPAVIGEMTDMLSEIPCVGQVVGMLPCACRVATAALDAAKDLGKVASDGRDCFEFAENCIGSLVQCAGSLLESGGDAWGD